MWRWRQGRSGAGNRGAKATGQLLAHQRTFLQDAAHELRTPITIALGHAELLAAELAGRREQQDIHVVVGELTRLKSLSERLLLIAASEDPEFLVLAPVTLDSFLIEALRRWQPTARRVWATGQLDAVTVAADRERLELAVDSLLENAVQHTGPGDTIRVSVTRDDDTATARLVVEDSGEGIPPSEVDHVFERFRTGPTRDGPRGTGLGLTLVRAVALGHAGEVSVRSAPGAGSSFELVLPATAPPGRSTGLQTQIAPEHSEEPGQRRWPPGGRRLRPAVVVAAMCAATLAAVMAVDGSTHRDAPVTEPAAPAFSLPSLRDPAQLVSLSAYRGHPVIVNFFASWCGPCREETPLMARYYKGAQSTVRVIGVDTNDSRTGALAFTKRYGVTYPVASDPAATTAGAFGVAGLPQTFFLNAQHKIVDRVYGAVSQAALAHGVKLMDQPAAAGG
jgi:thiol-disulfide isomerase/thioredoxin/anti-sigma regulatory factor (Ser/Thr protein kinase)